MSLIGDIFSSIEKILLNAGSGPSNTPLTVKGPSGDIHPGDVEIVSITMLSEDQQKTYNLMTQCIGFDLYESILTPTIFAVLSISDSIGLLQSFPIIGEEYVKICFRTPKTPGPPATYLFRVNKVTDKEFNENNKTLSYSIHLVSAELIKNSVTYVQKNYKQNISTIVKEIISDELGTQKSINIDNTQGIEMGNITRMQPFKAIDFLRHRAVSSEYKSQSWVFFENRNGYHFTTIEKLIHEGSKLHNSKDSDKRFFFDMSRKENVHNVTIRNIIAYNQLSFIDTISKTQSGGLKNDVSKFDMVTGNITKVKYDDSGVNGQIKQLDGPSSGNINTNHFKMSHGKTTASTKFIPTTTDRPPTYIAEKLNVLSAYAVKITQNITQIHVYGDSEITVGDVISCSFPSATSAENDKGISRLDSGNYLVAKVRHMVLNGDRPQHAMVLELLKGNFTEAI